MYDLAVLSRAKLYMEQLSKGTDPISGEHSPADSPLQNERLQRCFSFVAGVLDEVIANGGKVGKPLVVKQLPFSITPEQQMQIEVSEEPVGVNTIAKRIAAVLPPDVKKISGIQINNWCLLKGYLREDIYAGKSRKVTSLKGEQLGIITIDGVSKKGFAYKQNVFNINAQRFIIESLQIIADELAELENSENTGE